MKINNMKTNIIRSEERGIADHGWLKAKHSFSFGNSYMPERIQFGALRVLNDDLIAGGMGFPEHPHNNMEIITIPLSGSITHKDSMGNSGAISSHEIQVMSSGSGIYHSEKNTNIRESLSLFQIWILPNQMNVTPRYAQKNISDLIIPNTFTKLVGPQSDSSVGETWIHQNAWISLGHFDANRKEKINLNKENNGIFLMVIEGEIEISGNHLKNRDAIEISDITDIEFNIHQKSKILLIEVPI
jgi:quercetin 2,3-dioxygenase